MTPQEFRAIAHIEVSDAYYYDCVNDEYNESNLTKIQYIRRWKETGGVNDALYYEQRRVKRLTAQIEWQNKRRVAPSPNSPSIFIE